MTANWRRKLLFLVAIVRLPWFPSANQKFHPMKPISVSRTWAGQSRDESIVASTPDLPWLQRNAQVADQHVHTRYAVWAKY